MNIYFLRLFAANGSDGENRQKEKGIFMEEDMREKEENIYAMENHCWRFNWEQGIENKRVRGFLHVSFMHGAIVQ